jgi:hypothetical protein
MQRLFQELSFKYPGETMPPVKIDCYCHDNTFYELSCAATIIACCVTHLYVLKLNEQLKHEF